MLFRSRALIIEAYLEADFENLSGCASMCVFTMSDPSFRELRPLLTLPLGCATTAALPTAMYYRGDGSDNDDATSTWTGTTNETDDQQFLDESWLYLNSPERKSVCI